MHGDHCQLRLRTSQTEEQAARSQKRGAGCARAVARTTQRRNVSQGGNRSEKEERRRVVPKGGWELQGKVADVSVGLGRLFRAWLESLGFVDVGLHMRVNGRLIAPYGCSLSPRARGHRSADLIDAQRSLTSEVDEENVERENRKRNRPAAAQIGRVCYYGPLCTSYSLERANGKIVTKASSHRITDTQKIVCNIVRL